MLSEEEAFAFVETILKPNCLNDVQALVFRQCWQGETYQKIAETNGYDPDYIRVVGSRLWQLLSDTLDIKITKSNLHTALRQSLNQIPSQSVSPLGQLPFPDGTVPLNSPLYMERSPIEHRAYAEILKPAALLRIKAPSKMGKTSLMLRILAFAEENNYYTVRLNLQQADNTLFTHLDRFLRWICANIAHQLNKVPRLDDYWDEELGSKVICTTYLQGYILESLDNPLVLAIDEVNHLFEYGNIAQEFLPLLRFWHEEGNNIDIWQNLRLIIVHSTEIYIPLKFQQSPFNVGIPIQLPEFTLEQVETLASVHSLSSLIDDEGKEPLKNLMRMVGGHPYLIRLALYHLYQDRITMQQLLEEAANPTGIYHHHLQNHLITLQKNPDLAHAFAKVIKAQKPMQVETIIGYKLASMGLVKLQGKEVFPSCQLYCLYFSNFLVN
ncbi:MAG: AAA-like domain-containing protein [Crocosphaera sp.]|nr:AAA-like domain-containing protein [Crocosphaera sp.]